MIDTEHNVIYIVGIGVSHLCEGRNSEHWADCHSVTDEVCLPLKLFTEL